MLVLTRKHQEKIRIGDNITITILKTKGKAVRVGIEAPAEIAVVRGELAANAAGPAATPATTAAQPAARRGQRRVSRLEVPWPSETRPRATSPEVSLQRVARSSVSQLLPRLVGDGGPLRSMVEQRASV
jgi:carbon storage regulator CsrA